jgi:hypothetical protein
VEINLYVIFKSAIIPETSESQAVPLDAWGKIGKIGY